MRLFPCASGAVRVQGMALSFMLPLVVATDCSSRRAALASTVGAAATLLTKPAASSARKPPKPIVVTDRNGAAVTEAGWLATANARPDLVLGLDGEPYFLMTSADGARLLDYALRAECTHLGCVRAARSFVPWPTVPCLSGGRIDLMVAAQESLLRRITFHSLSNLMRWAPASPAHATVHSTPPLAYAAKARSNLEWPTHPAMILFTVSRHRL